MIRDAVYDHVDFFALFKRKWLKTRGRYEEILPDLVQWHQHLRQLLLLHAVRARDLDNDGFEMERAGTAL